MADNIILISGHRHTIWGCKTCGVIATCPSDLYEERRRSGGFNFCPNGHQWGWTKENSENEKVRLERDRLKQQLAQKDDEIAAQRRMREETERALSAQKGVATKLRKRASAGVCPCCTRTFTNMARHMKTKHPTFKAEAV